ncbi:NUDIX domain-containing protein [Streptomyces sp. M10(2022)]
METARERWGLPAARAAAIEEIPSEGAAELTKRPPASTRPAPRTSEVAHAVVARPHPHHRRYLPRSPPLRARSARRPPRRPRRPHRHRQPFHLHRPRHLRRDRRRPARPRPARTAPGERESPPGGHAEPSDESLPAAALRELHEETGMPPQTVTPWPGYETVPLDIDIHDMDARPSKGEPGHVHFDLRFLFRLHTADEVPVVLQEEEVGGIEWRSADRVSSRPCARSCSSSRSRPNRTGPTPPP